jgi:NADH-quinone oxidoreductase subunit J
VNAGAAYLLYLAFAGGAFALYFLAPRPDGRRAGRTAGWLAAIAAGGTALVASQRTAAAPGAYFYLFALVALLAAVRVVTHPKPVYSAVYFVLVVIAVAAILILQQAEFLAVALVIVYAGAILVTYLFVIMLAQQPGAPMYDRKAREPLLAVVAGFVLTGLVAGQSARSPHEAPSRAPARTAATRAAPASVPAYGNTASVGLAVMTRYPVALELAGVLLLVSMVGAVALARKRVPAEGGQPTAPRLGEIGKEVEPF